MGRSDRVYWCRVWLAGVYDLTHLKYGLIQVGPQPENHYLNLITSSSSDKDPASGCLNFEKVTINIWIILITHLGMFGLIWLLEIESILHDCFFF